jgi:hypothetical protein
VFRQRRQTREIAARYAAEGVTYTPNQKGLGTSAEHWRDRVEGVRHGYPFTVYSELRAVAPAHYSASDTLQSSEVIYHHASVPLAGTTPKLRVWNRVHIEDDQHGALTADRNAGAVATGFPDFDDRFLVFCGDLPLARRVFTRDLASWIISRPQSATYAKGSTVDLGLGRIRDVAKGIELCDGALSIEESGGRLEPDRVFTAVDYLIGLLTRLPTDLIPPRQAAPAGPQGVGR